MIEGVRSQKFFSYLYPDFGHRVACIFEEYKQTHKMQLVILESIRTFKRQNELYAKGRTMPGAIVTKARAGYSDHHYGIAIDAGFAGADPYLTKLAQSERVEDRKRFEFYWSELGRIAEEHGCIWGGRWKGLGDKPHICINYGPTMNDIFDFFSEHRDLTALWNKFDRIMGIEVGKGYSSKDAPFKAVPYWYILGEQPNQQGETDDEEI